MADIDCAKAASVTWDAWYECVFMLFSICDAPAMSEQMTDTVMRVLKWKPASVTYLDGTAVFSAHTSANRKDVHLLHTARAEWNDWL